jgi:hypothetical protein
LNNATTTTTSGAKSSRTLKSKNDKNHNLWKKKVWHCHTNAVGTLSDTHVPVDKRFWFETTHQVATATDTQKYMFLSWGRGW